MLIDGMPSALQWLDSSDYLTYVHESYRALLQRALERLLARLAIYDEQLRSRVVGAIRRVPEQILLNVLESPEVSARLLWPGEYEQEAIVSFLECSLEAESIICGAASRQLPSQTWNCSGTAYVETSGTIWRSPSIEGFPPLDFGSPYAKRIDLSGADRPKVPDRASFSPQEQAFLVSRLIRIRDELRATNEVVSRFVADFTRVLILQPDPEATRQFSSGSNGQYIGRSFVANPHLDGIYDELLADAIVHEAIHALLYMHERQESWITDESAFDVTPRIRSPWTGNLLPVRPYLQACFVWYGLLHFWSLALAAGRFERARVKEMIIRATVGFVGEPLTDRVQPWSSAISVDLLSAIQTMQARVASVFASSRIT
jgi:hypothetical protein